MKDPRPHSPLTTLGEELAQEIGVTALAGNDTSLVDVYYDTSLLQPSAFIDPLINTHRAKSPSEIFTSSVESESSNLTPHSRPFLDDGTSHYENELVSLDRVSCNIDEHSKFDDLSYGRDVESFNQEESVNFVPDPLYDDVFEEISSCSLEILPTSSIASCTGGESSVSDMSPCEVAENIEISNEAASPSSEDNHTIGKGKVNDLQRSALDAIFQVTDRPSRVLVLHIASELRLHHVTVKNFFSNARRRVRRAAARLHDPERSKRENRKRKEKRRLAALSAVASAAGATDDAKLASSTERSKVGLTSASGARVSSTLVNGDNSADTSRLDTSNNVSPLRRALMEKLADKVQRSAAQKSLAFSESASVKTNNEPRAFVTASSQAPTAFFPKDVSFTTENGSVASITIVQEPAAPASQIFSLEPLSETDMQLGTHDQSFPSLVDASFASIVDPLVQPCNNVTSSTSNFTNVNTPTSPQTLLGEPFDYQSDLWNFPLSH